MVIMVSVRSRLKVSLFHRERLVRERPMLLPGDSSSIFILGPVEDAYAYWRNKPLLLENFPKVSLM